MLLLKDRWTKSIYIIFSITLKNMTCIAPDWLIDLFVLVSLYLTSNIIQNNTDHYERVENLLSFVLSFTKSPTLPDKTKLEFKFSYTEITFQLFFNCSEWLVYVSPWLRWCMWSLRIMYAQIWHCNKTKIIWYSNTRAIVNAFLGYISLSFCLQGCMSGRNNPLQYNKCIRMRLLSGHTGI